MKKIRLSHFTLVEILAVIGIMVFMLYVAVPSFTKLARGGGTEYASRMLIAKIGQARGAAIYNRQNVAIIFYQADAGKAAGFLDSSAASRLDNFKNKAFRLCEVQKSGTDYIFKNWLKDETWSFLTPGVAVLQVNDNQNVDLSAAPNTFNASGNISKIYYSEALRTADADNYIPGIVFKPSGVSTDNRFVQIGEGTCTAGTLVVTNKNPGAYVTLTVSKYTGRISYGKE